MPYNEGVVASLGDWRGFMKSFALIAVCACAAVAHASFDLMLLAGADGRIHRYDPVNQVRLGSFGAGANATDLEINPTDGTVLALRSSTSTMALYNYNTGERTAFASGHGNAKTAHWNGSAGRFDVLYRSSGAFRDSVNVSPLQYTFGPSFDTLIENYSAVGSAAIGMTLPSGVATFHHFASGIGASTSTTTTQTGVTRVSNMVNTMGDTLKYVAFTTATDIRIRSISAASISPTLFGTTVLASFDITQPVSLVQSHNGFYVVGKDAATADFRVADYGAAGPNATFFSSTVVTGVGYTTTKATIFLAPEPGSLGVMGLGAFLLLRRRAR